jgi:predicted metalloprotease with PDZ domain
MGNAETRPGYRIIEVLKNSPGEQAGLQPYLDFVVTVNGTNLFESSLPFQELIKTNEDCPITLGVLSLIDMEIREVHAVPHKWEGEGLLGINLRLDDAFSALSNIIHILKVFPNSAASNAGLLAGEFILGSKEALIRDSADIKSVVEKNGEITLAVYNPSDKLVHFLLLESVDGNIGIEVATGVMHRISSRSR